MAEKEIKIDLRSDDDFVELLVARRAAMLAHVDAIEKFLDMPRTKKIRAEVKQLRFENEKLKTVL